MSDRANPDAEIKAGGAVEDDPLAELARIVAGETDEDALPDAQSGSDHPSDDQSANLDSQLEEELSQQFEAAPPENLNAGAASQDAGESFDHAMDQHMAELEEAFSAPAQPSAPAEETFEDGLISALQEEIVPEAEPAAAEPEADIVSELAAEIESPQPLEEVPAEAAPVEAEVAVAESTNVAAASIDEDLGAAFDSEFQQILSVNQPEESLVESVQQAAVAPDQAPVEVEQVAEVDLAQAMETSDASDTVPTENDPATVSVEEGLDFGSAFADELGLDTIEAAPGWESADTEAAKAEFRVAAAGDASAAVAKDPGHAGNVTAAPEQPVSPPPSAVQSGGSRKYAWAAMAVALFAGSIAAGYGFLSGGDAGVASGDPQIIKAEEGPVKVKPEDPGGRVVANQDKASYDGVEGNTAENLDQETLISNTEEPAKIQKTENSEVASLPGVETNLQPKTADRLESAVEPESSENAGLGDVKPRVVKTVTVKPDGTIIQNEVQPQQVTDLSQSLSGSVSGESSTIDTGLPKLKPLDSDSVVLPNPGPESIDGAVSSNKISVPEASPLPKPEQPVVNETVQSVTVAAAPEPEPQPTPVASSEWVVQVSSQRSQEAAQASFQNLKNRFNALQGRSMAIQQANVNGSTFYRVRVQTASRSDANTLCSNLKASGGSCFVTR